MIAGASGADHSCLNHDGAVSMTPALRVETRQLPDSDDRLPDHLHPVVRRVLLARGVNRPEQLNLNLRALARPDSLGGLEKATGLLADAIQNQRPMVIVGDFDADGATGSAAALRGLRAMGAAQLDFCVPNRFDFGYGLSRKLVEHLADQRGADVSPLLITVDNGVSSVDGVAAARELGWQVIVTDHHLPGESLPEADAMVNPNLDGDEFPSKALAGVGVLFYLLSALRRELARRNHFTRALPEPNLAGLLDLVALGTVADLVPLDHNNRILVSQGLVRIRAGRCCAGIRALLEVAGRNLAEVNAADMGFAVGPRLNAAGRLEDMSVGIRCLTTDDEDEARALARQLHELNQERRSRQQAMQDEADDIVSGLDAGNDGKLPLGVCLFRDNWHQGIVGLVASRVKDRLHRPVIAFAPESEGSDLLKGSARSVRGVHIRDILAHADARHPGLIDRFGGHAMAAGLQLHRDHLDRFRSAFNSALASHVSSSDLEPVIHTDGSLAPEDFSLELAQALAAAGPWGQRFPEPVFQGQFEVISRRVVGGSHLKMILAPAGGGPELDAIAFRTPMEVLPEGRETVPMVYRLDINRFRGRTSLQLIVERILG